LNSVFFAWMWLFGLWMALYKDDGLIL
jgi:hypothetical protein